MLSFVQPLASLTIRLLTRFTPETFTVVRNGPHRLGRLNTCCPVGGAVWGGSREVTALLSSWSLCSCLWWRQKISASCSGRLGQCYPGHRGHWPSNGPGHGVLSQQQESDKYSGLEWLCQTHRETENDNSGGIRTQCSLWGKRFGSYTKTGELNCSELWVPLLWGTELRGSHIWTTVLVCALSKAQQTKGRNNPSGKLLQRTWV